MLNNLFLLARGFDYRNAYIFICLLIVYAAKSIGQCKNLFYYYNHQSSIQEASAFWTECCAVRYYTFLMLNGFDVQRYQSHGIKDINLDCRIKQAKGEIFPVIDTQIKHHKAWVVSLIKTDILTGCTLEGI